jgi:hypothetical protein
MGAEEYARKKYNEYEKHLNEQKYKAEELKRTKVNYDSKNFETEQKVRDLLRELETEKQLKERALNDVDRQTKQLEYEHKDLSVKVRDDDLELRNKLNELNNMKVENDRAQEFIRELEQQTSQEEQEFYRIKNIADAERR